MRPSIVGLGGTKVLNIIFNTQPHNRYVIPSLLIALTVGIYGAAFAQTARTGVPTSGTWAELEEIVVTAEKVQSTAQHTPATIEVVNSETLQRQNIVEVTDLNNILTDTQIVPIIGSTQIYIRGIGSTFIDPRADPAVATSINGLFFARPLPVGFGLLDVSRVEVLEGPQGTLYGRNSAAGAVNFVTNQPTHDFGGSFSASGGNLGANDFTGVVNLPVTNDLSVRIAADRDRRDGYIDDYYNDINNDAGRISALWTPSDTLSVYVETAYTRIGGHGTFTESYPCAGSVAFSVVVPKACPPAGLLSGTAPLSGSEGSFVTTDQLQVEYDFGWAALTSISGFVGTHDRLYNSPNGSAFTNTIKINSDDYSEEIRLAGRDDASHQGGFGWQVGAYFFDSTGDYLSDVQVPGSNLPPTGTFTFSKIPQSSQAVYAQTTYGLTDHLRITAGLRYINDFKQINYGFESYAPPTFKTLAPPITGTSSYSGDKVIYKGGIEYDVAPNKLLYADVSTGYVSGGANGGNENSPLPANVTPAVFQPETITAYEVGSKNRFLDNRLQLNGDVFYYDFHNYQYLYPSLVQGGPLKHEALNIENAASATAYGVGLSAEFALTKEDRFSATLAWTHATFGSISLFGFVPPFGPALTIHVPSGSPLTNDPDWTSVLGYEHTWRLDQDSSVTVSANSKISSKYLVVVGSRDPYDYQKSYTMTDASLAYHWPHDKYVVRLWAKNLEDAKVNIYGEEQTDHLYEIEPPRTYGVTATVTF
jgi:iron complex outermembrane receptor protein